MRSSWGECCGRCLHETAKHGARTHWIQETNTIQIREQPVIRTAGVEDEVAVGGRVDDHDDLVEVAAVGGEEHELLLLPLLLGLGGCGRDLVGGAAEPSGAAREEREAGGGALLPELGLAVVVVEEEAGRGEG